MLRTLNAHLKKSFVNSITGNQILYTLLCPPKSRVCKYVCKKKKEKDSNSSTYPNSQETYYCHLGK